MDYAKKTIEIEEAMEELRRVKLQFPLVMDLIRKRQIIRKEYFARISYNLDIYGTSPLKFDDIDY